MSLQTRRVASHGSDLKSQSKISNRGDCYASLNLISAVILLAILVAVAP
jgi:hypothetical protein